MVSISVVTPSFNQGRFIRETMESIHGQEYPQLEHIVIDGGSSDESVAIIETYAPRLAYWVSERDEGQTDALAKGFARATGDVQCWLNSDDLFEPTTLHEVGRYFDEHPEVQFVYGNSSWIDDRGGFIKPKREHGFSRFIWMNDHNYIPQPSAFWRRGLYERVGGLDTAFDLAMDADLWIRFADVTRPRHVRRQWSRMRFYADQKNTRLRTASLLEVDEIRSRYGARRASEQAPVRRAAARTLRVLWKLASGCYSPAELRIHRKTLLGSGGWEHDQLADK